MVIIDCLTIVVNEREAWKLFLFQLSTGRKEMQWGIHHCLCASVSHPGSESVLGQNSLSLKRRMCRCWSSPRQRWRCTTIKIWPSQPLHIFTLHAADLYDISTWGSEKKNIDTPERWSVGRFFYLHKKTFASFIIFVVDWWSMQLRCYLHISDENFCCLFACILGIQLRKTAAGSSSSIC